MILCPICTAPCQGRRTFALHLTRSHGETFATELEKEILLTHTLFGKDVVDSTIQSYVDEKFCISDLPIDIAKLLTLMGIKRTSKQERATDRYKQKYIEAIQAKYGATITNVSQVKSVQEKKEKTYASKYGSYDRYLEHQRGRIMVGYNDYVESDKHRETLDKIQQTMLQKYGNSNFGQGEIAREKASKTRKETIATWDYEERLSRTSAARCAVNHRGGFSSKPEKRVRKILIDLEVEAKYNQHIWNYNWDLVTDRNIIIEVQGTMWHAKPGMYNEDDLIMGKILAKDIWEKDGRKRLKAESEGYRVVEIWEDEINSRNDEQLQNLVMERLKENGYEFYN